MRELIDAIKREVPNVTKDLPRDPIAEEIMDEVRKHTVLLQSIAQSQQLMVRNWNGLIDALSTINRNVEGLKRV